MPTSLRFLEVPHLTRIQQLCSLKIFLGHGVSVIAGTAAVSSDSPIMTTSENWGTSDVGMSTFPSSSGKVVTSFTSDTF